MLLFIASDVASKVLFVWHVMIILVRDLSMSGHVTTWFIV